VALLALCTAGLLTGACERGGDEVVLRTPDRRPPTLITADPVAGRLVPSASQPPWLRYHGGRHLFIAGPGDPEDFLYRGRLRADGTRDGDQAEIIARLSASGANSLYFQVVRSHGGDGDPTHNPFIGHDPASGLNEAVLGQWEEWLEALDDAGIVSYLFLYDDGARLWDTGDRVEAAEGEFVRALIARFRHHRHLVWVVAEEYSEAYTAARVSRLAREIKLADPGGHAVAVHTLEGADFSPFAEDPYVDQFAAQLGTGSASEVHDLMLAAWRRAARRYGVVLAEAPEWGDGAVARRKAWAAAMGGAYVLVYGMDVATTPDSDLRDLGRLAAFMNQTDFQTMAPLPQFAREDTRYLLLDPGRSYIAYADDAPASLGVAGMAPGRYRLHWFDPVAGRSQRILTAWVGSSRHRWDVPEDFGPEVVLHAARVDEAVAPVFPGADWTFREPALLGLSRDGLEALAGKWGGAGCVARFGYMAFCWGAIDQRLEWGSAAKPLLSTLLLFAVQEGRVADPHAQIAGLGWPLRGKDRAITLHHLANMTSGYARAEAPGRAFAYNDFAINLYGRSLEGIFGAPLDSVFQARLAPLQFQDRPALSSRHGYGLEASIRDAARLGLLWLRRGQLPDGALVSAPLAHRFMMPHVDPAVPLSRSGRDDYLDVGSFGALRSSEVAHGPGLYGYNWWFNYPVTSGGPLHWPDVPAGAFQANGHWGRELITVLPSLRMVIAATGPWGDLRRFIPGDPEAPTNRLLADILSAVQPLGEEIATAAGPAIREQRCPGTSDL
jgi:CubicO group peptidase (beta-lactamase class C family)